ncbi:MAG TPA: Ig-like domain-containing protein [Vicinamibacterales bacterium]|nr:Ig-like domain-containing protein [Vicinamibacterales bacterium]
MHVLRLAGPVLMLAAALGCGSKPNPAAPTAPAGPSISSLVINGADYLLTGGAAAYTATVTLSDGSSRSVTPSWTSSDTRVAAVAGAGRLEALAHGAIALTAVHEGFSASKTVHIVNDYGGSWSGRYVINVCRDSGVFADGIVGGGYVDVPWCRALNKVGSEHAFAFTIAQSGSDYGAIRATFGPDAGSISGSVTADGRLNLDGTLALLDWYGDHFGDLRFSGWNTTLDGAARMSGRWAQDYTMRGQPGSAYEEVELLTMTRTR